MKIDEFWEHHPDPRDNGYFLDEYGHLDIKKVFEFAEEYAQAEAQDRYDKGMKHWNTFRFDTRSDVLFIETLKLAAGL